MRRVTFSRNFTLSLSRTCQCYCKYCAFATHRAHLYSPAEVERILDDASRRGAKELLVLTGERPEVNAEVAARLAEYGHEDFTSYVAWACERAIERGMLPHTNLGALLARGPGPAARGHRLAGPDAGVDQSRPGGPPGLAHQAPGACAWRRSGPRASCAFRSPAGSWWASARPRRSGSRRSRRSPSLQREHGHLQEIILQNFVAHPRYYGAEPAEIADESQRGERPPGEELAPPCLGHADLLDDMRTLVRECRRLMPDVGVQIPPNLSDWWLPLIEEGATDLGGLSANGDHISPEHPFPSVHRMRKELAPRGYALTERLCVYPQYMDPDWLEQGVLDLVKLKFWSFIPRRGSGRREERPIRRDLVAGAIAPRPRRPSASPDELTALFAETRPEAIEDMRQAADELRRELAGETVTFVVNRNINVSNICTVGCAFCGFGQGRRSPDAYEHSEAEFVSRVRRGGRVRGQRDLHAVGHPPRVDDRGLRGLAAPGQAHGAASCICTRTRRWRSTRMAGDMPLAEVFARLKDAGLGSTPGTAAEVLHDGVRQRISPNKLPVARWVEIIEASHAAGLRSTVTVMFGHIEEPWELAEHMRVVRELQERTGGFTEFVPLSFIPFHTLLGRTHGIEAISREDNLKHTAAFRLALGKSIPSLQASWVKMGLDAATEALRWGVNDLGGTLHGRVDLAHGRLRARGAPRAAAT